MAKLTRSSATGTLKAPADVRPQPHGPPPFKDMVWIPVGTSSMRPDRFYPEEGPVPRSSFAAFWMHATSVTYDPVPALRQSDGICHVRGASSGPGIAILACWACLAPGGLGSGSGIAPYAVAVILSAAIVRQERARQRIQALYDQLRVAHDQLQALHAEVRNAAVTEERNRLAREIHDSLAHYLTVANIQLEAAEKLGTERAQAALEHVRRARRLTLECLQDVRRSVAALRAATLEELAIEPSIRRLVAEFAESTGLDVKLTLGISNSAPLSPDLAQTLYRAIQEGLTNIHKHAHASEVDLRLFGSNESFVLEIQDDGVGTTVTTNGHDSDALGYGLVGLRERVALLDGTMSFGPAPGGGSCLRLTLPTRLDKPPDIQTRDT